MRPTVAWSKNFRPGDLIGGQRAPPQTDEERIGMIQRGEARKAAVCFGVIDQKCAIDPARFELGARPFGHSLAGAIFAVANEEDDARWFVRGEPERLTAEERGTGR